MNVVKLVNKYLPVLDEQYRQQSKTAVLDMPKEWVRDTTNAKKVKIAKYKTDKLGNYSRSAGFVKGSMELDWEEHEFKIDRGRSIQVDHEDNEETFGMAFGRLAGVFQKEAVIPEMDAYRISVYAQAAGHKGAYALGSGSILREIDHLDAQMDDEEVPEDGRLLFVIPSAYEEIINDASLERKLEVNDEMTKALNKKIYSYNEHPIIKITSKRMYTAIKLLDGSTAGEEEGGYERAAGADQVAMLMVNRNAVVQISKRLVARIWAPSKDLAAGCDGVNPDADAWKFDFRVYHDAWVLENKALAIACLVLDETVLTVGKYENDEFTKGNSYLVKKGGKVTGTVPQGAAVPAIDLAAGNRFVIKLANPSITAKSQLPTGDIIRTINSTTGYENVKTRDVFEDDGSLIVVTNIEGKNTVYTVEIEWSKGFKSVYTFTFEDAEFPSA